MISANDNSHSLFHRHHLGSLLDVFQVVDDIIDGFVASLAELFIVHGPKIARSSRFTALLSAVAIFQLLLVAIEELALGGHLFIALLSFQVVVVV